MDFLILRPLSPETGYHILGRGGTRRPPHTQQPRPHLHTTQKGCFPDALPEAITIPTTPGGEGNPNLSKGVAPAGGWSRLRGCPLGSDLKANVDDTSSGRQNAATVRSTQRTCECPGHRKEKTARWNVTQGVNRAPPKHGIGGGGGFKKSAQLTGPLISYYELGNFFEAFVTVLPCKF